MSSVAQFHYSVYESSRLCEGSEELEEVSWVGVVHCFTAVCGPLRSCLLSWFGGGGGGGGGGVVGGGGGWGRCAHLLELSRQVIAFRRALGWFLHTSGIIVCRRV